MHLTLPLLCGILGLLTISGAIWVRSERTQDLWFIVGGILLLVYSISIDSVIFSILQIVFVCSSSFELWRLHAKEQTQTNN